MTQAYRSQYGSMNPAAMKLVLYLSEAIIPILVLYIVGFGILLSPIPSRY